MAYVLIKFQYILYNVLSKNYKTILNNKLYNLFNQHYGLLDLNIKNILLH